MPPDLDEQPLTLAILACTGVLIIAMFAYCAFKIITLAAHFVSPPY